jgi:hypothetical protein
MTAIASRSNIVEIESQVWSVGDGDLVICMQMALVQRERAPQLFEDLIDGRALESKLSEYSDDIGLPTTIDAPPVVALEAQDPQPAVMRVITTFPSGTAERIMLALPTATVLCARTTRRQFGTARRGARDE